MHFNLVIPICLLVISFAFFHEVLCEEEKIIVTNNRFARLSKRGKFSKRCGPTNTSNSGCQPFTNVADPINGAANGINTATKSLPVQGIPAVPASNGYVPAYQPAPVNPLGLDAVTGSFLSTFPNLGGAPTYPTAQPLVAQPVTQIQPVAQAPRPVAQVPQPVAQALLPVTQAPVYGSSSIYPGSVTTSPSTTAAISKEDKKKGDDDDDDDDDDDKKKKSSSDNEDDDDSNNEDDDDEE